MRRLLDLMRLLDLERDDLVRARPGRKKLPHPREVMAIAEALARAPAEKVKAVARIVKAQGGFHILDRSQSLLRQGIGSFGRNR